MEDPRIRKLARFLIRGAVELQKDEKILIELHGSETGLMKALVQEAYDVRSTAEPVPAVALAWMAIKLVAACACLAGVRGFFLLEMMVGRTGINNATRD